MPNCLVMSLGSLPDDSIRRIINLLSPHRPLCIVSEASTHLWRLAEAVAEQVCESMGRRKLVTAHTWRRVLSHMGGPLRRELSLQRPDGEVSRLAIALGDGERVAVAGSTLAVWDLRQGGQLLWRELLPANVMHQAVRGVLELDESRLVR